MFNVKRSSSPLRLTAWPNPFELGSFIGPEFWILRQNHEPSGPSGVLLVTGVLLKWEICCCKVGIIVPSRSTGIPTKPS